MRFLYTLGEPGVYAWDLPNPPDPRTLDIPRYQELLLRAAETVLQVTTFCEIRGNEQYLLPIKPLRRERIEPEHRTAAQSLSLQPAFKPALPAAVPVPA